MKRWRRNEALVVVEERGLFLYHSFYAGLSCGENAADNRAALVPYW